MQGRPTRRSTQHVTRAALIAALGAVACQCNGGAASPTRRIGPGWDYDVTAGPGGTDLSVVATFPRGTDAHLTVMPHAETYLVGVAVEHKGDSERPWHDVRRLGSEWLIPECIDGCRVRYRFLLADGAAAWGDLSLASREDGVIEAPPSTWLLRPEHTALGTAMRFHVTTAPGDAFVSGVFAAPGTPSSAGIYEAHVGDFLQLPYSAVGPMRVRELDEGAATLALLPGQVAEPDLLAWVESSLAAVRGFYGRLPVPHVLLIVAPAGGDEVGFGMTMGFSGAAIVIHVGNRTTRAAFARDWILVHELVHTALPDLPDEQHWLEEGLATYVEPLARYRKQGLTATEVWTEWALKMKQGQPAEGDEGLDATHTWGRTYWGGALFCLAADVEIRARTRGKASLDDALKAILAAGGNISVTWPMARLLEVGDGATGTTVLHETYERLAKHPTPVDLPGLWKRLGVVLHGEDAVTFDDQAELAWVRRAMTP
jgi:hypothetical protein